jgi:hypothetical protein
MYSVPVHRFVFGAHGLRICHGLSFRTEITKNVLMERTCSIHDGEKYIRNVLKNMELGMFVC